MSRKFLCFMAFLCLFSSSLSAQDKPARDRLAYAHALYYTPTTGGLKSFHCDAAMDWKALLTRFSGQDIPEGNPALVYLHTVHLSVTDNLNGQGSLDWSADAPPKGMEDAVQQIRDGLKASVTGFFQSWNAYMNGSMVPLPDSTITVTAVGDGLHLSGLAKDTKLDEDFDKNLLLKQALVVTPSLRVLATPTFSTTPDGLLISTVKSQVNQPPDAPEAEATFRIEYAKVDSFQIPSHVVFDIKNTGVIEIGFNACQVSVADAAKKQ
jgi:hypothetical protein